MTDIPATPEVLPDVFLVGDYLAMPSVEGAVSSGLAAARAVAGRLDAVAAVPELPASRPSFVRRFTVDAPVTAVAAFHEGPDALARLQPPLSGARFLRVNPLGEGSITDFELGPRPQESPVGPGGRGSSRIGVPGIAPTAPSPLDRKRRAIYRGR